MKAFAFLALVAVLPLVAACGESDDAAASAAPDSLPIVGRHVRQAMDKARTELATKNIDLDRVHISGSRIDLGGDGGGRARAEITPQGELLIDGRKIQANAEQQALLLEYRRGIEGIASAGMDIGAAGAELGVKAATEALKGIFSGNAEQIERRVEAEAGKIKASAVKLCDQLPDLLDTQTRLAAAMPEFRPYATLDRSDIDDCYDEHAMPQTHTADATGDDPAGDDAPRGANAAAEAEAASAASHRTR